MKGLILSGGKGTRLRPITHTSAKQLVPVANKPVLFYALEALVEAGITEIGIVTGETEAEIINAVGNGSQFGAQVTYIHQEAPLGLAHAVKISQDFLGDDCFVMYLGDNLIRQGITSFVYEFKSQQSDALILLAQVKDPQRFGVAEIEDGKVIGLVEKPENPKSDLALVGVYLFCPTVFKAIDSIKPSARGELEITEAIQWLIDNKFNVNSHLVDGWWKDTGKLEDMLEANRIMLGAIGTSNLGVLGENVTLEGQVVIQKGAKLMNCLIRGPVIIGEDCIIEDAYVGPFTSIYHNCVIQNAEIEHSIILENSTITNIPSKIESSLIGKDCQVIQSPSRPKALKLMLGDHSKVEI